MVVVIPNPNDQLLLVKLQEKLCCSYISKADYLCKSFPLWIPIPETENITSKDLKKFSKSIKSVIIESPAESLECPVTITIESLKISSKLKLLYSSNLKKISPQAESPVSLKSFRIGIIKQNSTNTISITDSVWVKL